jgi:hypothetical protein
MISHDMESLRAQFKRYSCSRSVSLGTQLSYIDFAPILCEYSGACSRLTKTSSLNLTEK